MNQVAGILIINYTCCSVFLKNIQFKSCHFKRGIITVKSDTVSFYTEAPLIESINMDKLLYFFS